MSYHYTESGLDNIWLENGYAIENHENYGELVSIQNVRALHEAIGRWLITRSRPLTGAEFRFLRTELDASQRVVAGLLGVNEQSVAKWEKARDKPVANQSAERLLRLAYKNYLDGPEFSAIMDRITKLDAEEANRALHLSRQDGGWGKAA